MIDLCLYLFSRGDFLNATRVILVSYPTSSNTDCIKDSYVTNIFKCSLPYNFKFLIRETKNMAILNNQNIL